MIQFRTGEPVGRALTLADLKAHLRLGHDSEDLYLEGFIDAAIEEVELATGCALVEQPWRLTADDMPRFGQFTFKVWPLRSIETVTIYDRDGNAFSLGAADWKLSAETRPARFVVDGGARKAAAIEIDFIAGFGESAEEMPGLLRQAMLNLCAYWYEHRASLKGEAKGYPDSFVRLVSKFRDRRL
ncbi:head-tail connector protein [Limoniibacter endophyticus]|uniref:PhiE125 gp8 family phage protein n=1 Tax=Limoniibacter endophyticus TaxID=1565040 RepID=A0A8J3DI70_9HYPH|nr:head-tail connector protein [Limoniibacter endophyticus]GHC69332.1 hypothetical protein GCM10010136_15060 [Limoniibacter endophyticus]